MSERAMPLQPRVAALPLWKTMPGSADDGQVVRYLDQLLVHAHRVGASDLHFEPYEQLYRIRMRVDGQLSELDAPPLAVKDRIASRIKVLAKLDISEKRLPQDGRLRHSVGGQRAIDFRVSTLPTVFGEKVVLRLLNAGPAHLELDSLGYEDAQKSLLLQAIGRPWGMVLVTGPTGSGKTLSLYSALSLLNQAGLNISTAEDPTEINLPGINQVNINEKAGLDFALALRAFLRQDPDVIMVGEIRDLETADMALKAAQTGHMVLSTLHTNDAPSSLTRLCQMGVAPHNITASLALVTAQRLVRRLCVHCRQARTSPRAALLQAGFANEDLDGSWPLFAASGCAQCHQGYKGRLGVFQVMPVSEDMQRLILQGASSLDFARQAACEGVLSLRQAGLRKVKLGLTSLEEVLNHTNDPVFFDDARTPVG
jgi:type IV pilus assembly protein PilB